MNLEQWKELPNYWEDHLETEEGTKIHIITPLLEALNWDIGSMPESNNRVEPEYKVQDGSSKKRVDYAFMIDGRPEVYVEAKNVNSPLREKNRNQLFSYMRNDGVRFGLLTNGREMQLFINDLKSEEPRQYLVGEFSNKNDYVDFLQLIEKENLTDGTSLEIYEDIIGLKRREAPDYTNLREKLKEYRITYTPDKMLSTLFDGYSVTEESADSSVIKTSSSKIEAPLDTRCGFYTGTKESIDELFIDDLVWGAVKKPKKDIEYIAMYSKEDSAITHIGEIEDCIPVANYPNAEDLPSYEEEKVVFTLSKVYELTDQIVHSSSGSFGFQFKYTTIEKLKYADKISDI